MNQNATFKSYLIGFLLSLILTFTAYFAVVNRAYSGSSLIAVILGLALAQLLVQLIFFLHLLDESKPRWNLVIFLSTISTILILVIGSLWIMSHLNYNMMPSEMEEFLLRDEGVR